MKNKAISATPMPKVVSTAQWQSARERLLAKEKRATRLLDALAAARRKLPMVKLEKPYFFVGEHGRASLHDLFEGRRQLIVYHFMFAPGWKTGCPGCARRMDDVGHLAHLHARNTTFVAIARTSYVKLSATRAKRMGAPVLFLEQDIVQPRHGRHAGQR